MTLIQAASSKLSLSNRIYALLNLLSSADSIIEINERYKIYSQAHYDLRANGFIISVRLRVPIASSIHPSYVLHVRCVDDEWVKSYKIN